MPKFYLLCLALIIAGTGFSQSGTLKGKLVDSVGKQSLKDASVTVLDAKDSTLEVYGLARDNGTFEIKGVSMGNFIVQISFQGYATFYKHVNFSKDNLNIDLGNVYMKVKAQELDEVVVTESPIKMKGDTTEYNAGSFKTKPNAVVEDLLKKLPGMQVDAAGNVSHAGEAVQRILVDGKRFFGDDPKMATKNLPPDIVDKIQVFDDLSDQSKFSGFDDGNRVKTINITTKKDKRKGYFGKGIASGGLDNNHKGVYDESLNINRFDGDQQITVLGQANDINKQNFTSGSGSGSGSGSAGITTTLAGGGNYHDSWGKKNNTDVAGSYFYNNLKTENGSASSSQTIINDNADSVTANNRSSNSVSKNQNHRINLNIESKIDSFNSLIVRPNFSYTSTHSNSSSITNTFYQKGLDSIYDANSSANSENSGYNGSIDATFRHRLHRVGQTYSINVNGSRNTSDGDGVNFSDNTYYNPPRVNNIDQKYNSNSHSNAYGTRLSFTQPVVKGQVVELNYSYSYNTSPSNRQTYLLDAVTGQYDILDSALSNEYNNTYRSHTVGLNYRVVGKKYNLTAGSGVQFGDQNSINQSKGYTIDNKYTNITPTANFTYNFTKTKSLRLFYTGRTGQPSVSQLQPLTTTSDSINFSTGNTRLKQQFTHSFRLLYHSFDVVTQQAMFITINASAITNDIQNSTVYLKTIDPTVTNPLAQITMPVNLNGTYNVAGTFMYSFPLRKPKSNLTFTTNVNYGQSQNLLNDTSNYTRNTKVGETIGWTTNLKDNFDMNFFSTTGYNYGSQTLNKGSNTSTYNETLSTEATYYTHSGWIVASDFSYNINWGLSAGYNTSYPVWNASFSKQVMKNKAGEIKLYVFDLLNKNANVSHTVNGPTTTDSRNMVLPRYFMLSFTYNLRRFGAAGNQQRMPGLFRGNRDGGGNGGFGGGFGGGGRGRGPL